MCGVFFSFMIIFHGWGNDSCFQGEDCGGFWWVIHRVNRVWMGKGVDKGVFDDCFGAKLGCADVGVAAKSLPLEVSEASVASGDKKRAERINRNKRACSRRLRLRIGGSRLRLTEGVVLRLVARRCVPLQLCVCAGLYFLTREKVPKSARGRKIEPVSLRPRTPLPAMG